MSNVKRITVDVVKETVWDLETFDWEIGKEDALYVREVAVDQLEIEFAKEVHEHHVFNLVWSPAEFRKIHAYKCTVDEPDLLITGYTYSNQQLYLVFRFLLTSVTQEKGTLVKRESLVFISFSPSIFGILRLYLKLTI